MKDSEDISNQKNKKLLTQEERDFLNSRKTREFPKSDKTIQHGVLTYTEHVVLGHLDKGSFFCGRALFNNKDYEVR
jgi:hypothetical protein